MGVNDNPKENRLFGRDLDELEDTLGVRFWEENGQAHTLWSAALYQEADTIREAADAALELYEIVTDHHTVRLPLRVNWGGGWSDTPPYCNEKGGTVLNATILLNGEKPVEVTLERIPEQKVIFDSA